MKNLFKFKSNKETTLKHSGEHLNEIVKSYFHFSLDNKGKVETLSHNTKHTDEIIQNWFDQLVDKGHIILNQRIEGYIEIIGKDMSMEYRSYPTDDLSIFSEVENNFKIPYQMFGN